MVPNQAIEGGPLQKRRVRSLTNSPIIRTTVTKRPGYACVLITLCVLLVYPDVLGGLGMVVVVVGLADCICRELIEQMLMPTIFSM